MRVEFHGGAEFTRIDVVLTAHGLRRFADEYVTGVEREIEGVVLRILPLDRVIASKRATNRPKDAASPPALEATLRAKANSTENPSGPAVFTDPT